MNRDGQIEYEEFAFTLMTLLPMEQPEEIRGPFEDVDINSKQNPLIVILYMPQQILINQRSLALISTSFAKQSITILSAQMTLLTLCLQVSSADNLDKQFGPRSDPTNRRA